jgi:hypothetical protein
VTCVRVREVMFIFEMEFQQGKGGLEDRLNATTGDSRCELTRVSV